MMHGALHSVGKFMVPPDNPRVLAYYRRAGIRPEHYGWTADQRPTSADHLAQALAQTGEPVLICGHSHISWTYARDGRLVLNPGAVGAPNNDDTRAQYVLLSWSKGCWQAELRPHNIRVFSVCPSEVQTAWGGKVGRNNPNKLFAEDIATAILSALSTHRRGFWPEFAVFATNPWQEN